MKPQDAWLATQGQLELQLNRATYDTWIRDCRFVSFEDGLFTFHVRNAYIKDWLEQRLKRSICHTLSSIMRQTVDVCFVVGNSAPVWNWGHSSLPLLPETEATLPSPSAAIEASTFAYDDIHEPNWDNHLNPSYTFENFIVGSSNQMAHAAAQAVSHDSPYNPLFVYGDVGLGKTHLLHAIGNAATKQGQRVLYITSEEFTNHLVESIRNRTMAEFRDHYRTVDILLIDDVQFIAGKESTQEEFFHTFNTLHDQNKQVVIAADRRPGDISGLEKRLLSRLEWGLMVEIQSPSVETRLAIVRDKAEVQGHYLPNDVAQLVAETTTGNVRELEGALTQVLAYTALMGVPLTLDIAKRVLIEQRGSRATRRRDKVAEQRHLTAEQVLAAVASMLQLSLKDLTGKRRTQDVADARHVIAYVVREETQASWPEIGRLLGGRNHSTIVYSYNKIAEQIASDPAFQRKMSDLRQRIREAAS